MLRPHSLSPSSRSPCHPFAPTPSGRRAALPHPSFRTEQADFFHPVAPATGRPAEREISLLLSSTCAMNLSPPRFAFIPPHPAPLGASRAPLHAPTASDFN